MGRTSPRTDPPRRWPLKVSGPKPVKFSEPDEWPAVARFHKIVVERDGNRKSLIPMGVFKDAGEEAKRMIAVATKPPSREDIAEPADTPGHADLWDL